MPKRLQLIYGFGHLRILTFGCYRAGGAPFPLFFSTFSNPPSCDRIVFGVISHMNRSWERKPISEFTQNA